MTAATRRFLLACLTAFAVVSAHAESERSLRVSDGIAETPSSSPNPSPSRYSRDGYGPANGMRPNTRYSGREQRIEALRNRYPMPRDISQGMHQAIEQAQRTHGGKVLSADRMRNDGRDVYRVKLLTPSGRVRVVQLQQQDSSPAPEPREQQGEQ